MSGQVRRGDNRVRVLQVHNRYQQPGGEDVVVDAEAALLRAAGHEVVVHRVNNAGGGAATRDLLLSPWNPHSAAEVARVAASAEADIVHVHNTWFRLSPATVAALGRRLPLVLTLHNYRLLCANAVLRRDDHVCQDCVGSHPFHAVRHGCYRGSRLQSMPAALTIAANRARGTWNNTVDVFLALSDFGREVFVRGGLPPERVRVKPHFVSDPGGRSAPPSASREVLCVGRLDDAKGIDTLIAAFACRTDERLRLTVIGSGDDADRLRRLAGPLVRFVGHLPRAEVMARMCAARALAFPTRMYETFGLTIVEAMAAGLPVLASDLGGTPEIVSADTGLVVVPGDVDAWTTALDRLDDAAWVDAAGAHGRTRWQRLFSPQRGLELLESAYQSAHAHAALRLKRRARIG